MNQKEIRLYLEKFNDSGRFVFSNRRYVFFSPALVLIMLGLAVVLMPKLFLYFIAAFFLTVGCIATFLIWKFLQFKQKFDKLSKDFRGQVIVHGVRVEGDVQAGYGDRSSEKNTNLQSIRPRQTNLFEEPYAGELSLTELSPKEVKKIIFH